MKNTIRIFAVLAIVSMSSFMKSQIINPFPIENKDLNCPVEVTINEYDAACTLIASNVVNVGPTATNFWSLNAATVDIEVIVNWASNPSCTSGVNVLISCGGACTPTAANPATLSFGCCPTITRLLVTCAAGALIY